ncbi:MAG: hypothetical protein IJU91_10755 [Selenomonadaceae bacterium]|nr:hypothetical protein [Selenomonadaceae bacterium]
MAVSKAELLDTLTRYRVAQKLVDDDAYAAKTDLQSYLQTVQKTDNGAKFLDGTGKVVCEFSFSGDAAAGVEIATDEEVDEMLDKILN